MYTPPLCRVKSDIKWVGSINDPVCILAGTPRMRTIIVVYWTPQNVRCDLALGRYKKFLGDGRYIYYIHTYTCIRTPWHRMRESLLWFLYVLRYAHPKKTYVDLALGCTKTFWMLVEQKGYTTDILYTLNCIKTPRCQTREFLVVLIHV